MEERMVFGRGFLAPSIQYIKIPSGKHPSIRLQMEMPRDRIAHVFSVDRYVFDAEILEGKPKPFKVIFGIGLGIKILLDPYNCVLDIVWPPSLIRQGNSNCLWVSINMEITRIRRKLMQELRLQEIMRGLLEETSSSRLQLHGKL